MDKLSGNLREKDNTKVRLNLRAEKVDYDSGRPCLMLHSLGRFMVVVGRMISLGTLSARGFLPSHRALY